MSRMALNQIQSSIELQDLGDDPPRSERSPDSQIVETQEVNRATFDPPSPPFEATRASSQPSSASWPRTQSSWTLPSIRSAASTIRWSRILTTINFIAAFITIISFPSTILSVRATIEALKVSAWTQSKDAFELCSNHDFKFQGCEMFKDKSLQIPNNPSLFGRGATSSDSKNEYCLPNRGMCWICLNNDPLILFGIYFCFLIIEMTVLWKSSSRLVRIILKFFKATSAAHKAKFEALAKVVVLSEAATASAISDEATSNNGQLVRRRNTKRQETPEHTRGPLKDPMVYDNSTRSSRYGTISQSCTPTVISSHEIVSSRDSPAADDEDYIGYDSDPGSSNQRQGRHSTSVNDYEESIFVHYSANSQSHFHTTHNPYHADYYPGQQTIG